MPSFPSLPAFITKPCKDAVAGFCLGFVEATTGYSFLNPSEVDDVVGLRKLAESVREKATDLGPAPQHLCDKIKAGNLDALPDIISAAPSQAKAASFAAAAQIVCTKAVTNKRFTEPLMGACLNLLYCK